MSMGSRRKGNEYMREICRALSAWVCPTWSDVTDQARLPIRVRSTSVMPVEGHWQGKGDLLHRPDFYFPFSVECKKHEAWSLDGFANKKWPVWAWWEQTCAQAGAHSGTLDTVAPMLIFSKNRFPDFVMVRQDTATWLALTAKVAPIIVLGTEGNPPVVVTTLGNLTAHPLKRPLAAKLPNSVPRRRP